MSAKQVSWALALAACTADVERLTPADPMPSPDSLGQALLPIPDVPPLDPKHVALGRSLFHDGRLSATGEFSCATCHDLGAAGTDNRLRTGKNGQLVNTPTVVNAALNYRQFWDGHARSLDEQIDGPIHNSKEMATTWPDIIRRLSAGPGYRAKFDEIDGAAITAHSIKSAIVTYESTLLAVDSPFDRYLRGDSSAIPDEARRGYSLFTSYGCSSCHQGANVGGNLMQPMGVVQAVEGAGSDALYRVPSLRLAIRTAPYFHDGSAASLDRAIELMGRHQLGIEIDGESRRLIATFIATLAGRWQP